MTTVLVLGGGPDAEREVSLNSAREIAQALKQNRALTVVEHTIGRITQGEINALEGDVFFPALHGAFGEGGPLQALLERDGRPYVGSGPRTARLAMDKIATKLIASGMGIHTPQACVLNVADEACPIGLPVVVKPTHEGSSVGLHICRTEQQWAAALDTVRKDRAANPNRVYMVERLVLGRELTVGLLDNAALPTIHIAAASGTYDYDAKYNRDDTRYILEPDLPQGVDAALAEHAVKLAETLGVRHLARVDFMLDMNDTPWLIELNTMPGFTTHSLVPMAAGRKGFAMDRLCSWLVEIAVRDRQAVA
jgi:D-alanine-D-alanine ligase